MNSAAPGWYPDPDDAQYQRWWDGYQWTHHSNRPQVQHPPAAPPQASAPVEVEPPVAPSKKRKKVVFSLVGSVAAAALVVGGIVVVNAVTADNGFGGSGSFEANGYLWEPVTYLGPDEPFSIPFDVDPDTLSTANDAGSTTRGVIDVYVDDKFTIVPTSTSVYWTDDGKGVEVTARDFAQYPWASDSEPARADSSAIGQDIETSPGGAGETLGAMWTEMDRYYIVQSFDRSGEKLKVPIVHTVEALDEEDVIHDPIELTTSVGDTPGSVKLSWNKPKGMDTEFTYYIIKTRPEDVLIDGEFTGVRSIWPELIAETKDTSWQPKPIEDYDERSSANWELALYGLDSADDLNFGTAAGMPLTRSKSDLAVIALADDRTERTSIVYQEMTDEIGGFPFQKASNQARDLFPTDAGDLTQISTWYPITTLNGDTTKMGVRIDTAAIQAKYESFWYLDGRGAYYTSMPFTVLGTKMTGTITAVKPDNLSESEWLAQSIANAEAYNARAEAEALPTGDDTIVQDASMSLDAFADMEAVKKVPDSEYEVYGSNEFSTFLAGHMVAGTRLIDITEFVETPGFPSADDAAYEAIRQNSMLKMSVDTYRVSGNNLYVNYTATAEEDKSQVDKAADEAVSAAITEGMSETEKVTAINQWIVDNMEYDYQALAALEGTFGRIIEDNQRYSDARGGLIDKLVICGGYADTFNLLARKAGLESVYVSGIIADSGSAHAWNHVKVDGEWKAIDTTWNEGDDATEYLLINEADFTGVAARSTKDSGWIVPQYQHLYKTP